MIICAPRSLTIIGQYLMDMPDLAKTDPDSAHIFAQMPGTIFAMYG